MSVRLVHLSANGKDRDHMRRIARVPVMMPLTSSEIEDIAKQTARAAVQETLLTLGVNTFASYCSPYGRNDTGHRDTG